MPVVGLGTWKSKSGEVEAAVTHAICEAGYRHIDAAQIYGNQEEVGRGIRHAIDKCGVKRGELWITTRYGWSTTGRRTCRLPWTGSCGSSAWTMSTSCCCTGRCRSRGPPPGARRAALSASLAPTTPCGLGARTATTSSPTSPSWRPGGRSSARSGPGRCAPSGCPTFSRPRSTS
ncbi:unnamed protein product [Prorocentrum cordatum]|uniref:NADP-dependent oxidoreductase domain-containing protein n=1 Tax=Prorocentrum cordatum TaxID=2364126 RepID=A0ABN9QXQ3_9DINO|nr:unnamed protein product [Polarella glacialis]